MNIILKANLLLMSKRNINNGLHLKQRILFSITSDHSIKSKDLNMERVVDQTQAVVGDGPDGPAADDCADKYIDQTLVNPYIKEKRQCILCKYGVQVDYKNVQLLSQFVSPYTGRLYDKHITGLCEKQHQVLKREHKRAVRFCLISPVYRDPKFVNNPRLFDPTKPQRPNPY